jgi:hypothetical protein
MSQYHNAQATAIGVTRSLCRTSTTTMGDLHRRSIARVPKDDLPANPAPNLSVAALPYRGPTPQCDMIGHCAHGTAKQADLAVTYRADSWRSAASRPSDGTTETSILIVELPACFLILPETPTMNWSWPRKPSLGV